MRTRRSEPDRQDVVARRLALLSPVPIGEERATPRALALVRGSDARQPGARPGHQDDLDPAEPPWWDDHTRVRPPTSLADLVPEPAVAVPAGTASPGADRPGVEVPVPGRHASRRAVVPPPWVPRLGVAHLAVLAVLVALGLAATSWWVVRSEPVPVSAPVRDGPAEPALLELPVDAATGPAGVEAPAGSVVVDVAGAVRRPGVRELPAGSRVVDAIEAAGGARPGVDLSGLNLARVLVDGEQVLVGRAPAGSAGAAPAPPAGSAPGVPHVPGALVNLNTADQAALEALPEIGPVTAQAIIAWREEQGGFTAVQELLEVSGIGPATLEAVAPLVTL